MAQICTRVSVSYREPWQRISSQTAHTRRGATQGRPRASTDLRLAANNECDCRSMCNSAAERLDEVRSAEGGITITRLAFAHALEKKIDVEASQQAFGQTIRGRTRSSNAKSKCICVEGRERHCPTLAGRQSEREGCCTKARHEPTNSCPTSSI
jgi:hypothetical protein